MTPNKSYTLGELAQLLKLDLVGDGDCVVTGIGTLKNAVSGQIGFLSNTAYVDQLADTKASAVILLSRHQLSCPTNKLISANPYVSFADATALFSDAPRLVAGVHPSACVDSNVSVPSDTGIGANAVVEKGAVIGRGVSIGSGCFVGENCVIGDDSRLYSGVTLYHKVKLGSRVTIHAGSVIGADGFGFAFDGKRSVKIHQLGSVVIGDDVEIGASTTIDRGAIEDTTVANGVKIDNHVQIGHNCIIGEHSILCGCVALAGSVTIGKYCIMGGGSGAVGHITIADKTQVSAMSLVSKSILAPDVYSSGTGQMKTSDWKRAIVRFQQLDSIAKRVKKLEQNSDDNNDG